VFLEAARPAFVVFEAGVDHLGGDAMGHLALTERCVRHVTERLVALAERHAEGRLLVLGGGSYSADGACRGWGAVVEALVAR
jgi:acetoin utilization deacetylase AcuC-like enzyme